MTKRDVVTKADVEVYYNKCRKIRFKKENKLKTYSLQDIFDNMCSVVVNNPPATVYLRGGHHCKEGKVRSLDDIFKLVKHYYPKITIAEILIDLVKYKEGNLYYRYCPNIGKYNFNGTSWHSISFLRKIDDFCITTLGFPNGKATLGDFLI